LALVETVDYITPVVDDAYAYGAIAAANALSDAYAMGAQPLFALNMVGFPAKTLPLSVLGEIIRGGADKVAEAGASIVGGHSIDDNEPKYGLCVTALIQPDKLVTNATARVGDLLILTKPLGIGIITTGIDRGVVDEKTTDKVVEQMATLNKMAAEAMLEVGVNACTDITGFGLLGHLSEMTSASKVGARIFLERVPVIDEAWELVERGVAPGGSHNNHRFLQDSVTYEDGISFQAQLVLCDAQTSGGLLISVAASKGDALQEALRARGVEGAVIGEVLDDGQGRIWVSRG